MSIFKTNLWIICCICCLSIQHATAQDVKILQFRDIQKVDTVRKSMPHQNYILPDLKADIKPAKHTATQLSDETALSIISSNPMESSLPKINPNALPNAKNLYPTLPSFADFYGTHTTINGLMDMRSVGIGKRISSGPFFLDGGTRLTQVGSSFGGTFTRPSINGNLGIAVTEWLTVGGYGQFTGTNYHDMLPITVTEMPQNRFGGFAEFKINSHISIHFNYGRELNPFTGKWKDTWEIYPIIH